MSDRLAALLAGDTAAGRNPFIAGGGAADLAEACGFDLDSLVAAGLSSLTAGGYQGYEKQAAGAGSPLFAGWGNPVFGGRRGRNNWQEQRQEAIQQALAAKVAETVARNTPVGYDMAPKEERRFPFALNSDPQFPSGIAVGAQVQVQRIALVAIRFYKYITGTVSAAFTFQQLSVGVDVMQASLDAIDASTFGTQGQENGVDFRPCMPNTPISVTVNNGGTGTAAYRSTLWGHVHK